MLRQQLIDEVNDTLDGKLVLHNFSAGDVAKVREGVSYSACENFGKGRWLQVGDIGVVWSVGKNTPLIEELLPIWVTFPGIGKYCIYRKYLTLMNRKL